MMKMQSMQIVVLTAATAFAPAVVMGQMGNQPGAVPSQPTAAQTNAGAGMAGAMTGSPSASAGDAQTVKDKMFLRKAAAGGMAEVQLGQLAAQKGNSADVKSFGQKMVTDHTALNDDMKPIAQSMSVMLPTKMKKEDQAEYDKLNGLSGDDFDKEYLAFMVKDHRMDLREFRMEDAAVQDPTLKAAVEKGLSVIREHSKMVDKLAESKGVPVPQRGGHGGPPAPPAQ